MMICLLMSKLPPSKASQTNETSGKWTRVFLVKFNKTLYLYGICVAAETLEFFSYDVKLYITRLCWILDYYLCSISP